MTRRKVSNPLALAVLSCLLERPMHPYEMSTTMRERHKEDSIKLNYGSLYSVVESLARHNLIAARETVRAGRRPERTVYEITDAGRTEFVDWLSELVSVPVKEFTQFEAALSLLAGLAPQDARRLLEQRAQRLSHELRAIAAGLQAAGAEGLPRLFSVEVEYRQALREAELQFVRKLLGQLIDGTLDGLAQWQAFHAEEPAATSGPENPPVEAAEPFRGRGT
ncbi:MAG TPA: PadR family transcriptional regulator [Pseudonocardiaceae bacterium]|nr:PadR family transcriptional regulator [Pseudonocardiaceae bacterium]